jgi:hypothetical protein
VGRDVEESAEVGHGMGWTIDWRTGSREKAKMKMVSIGTTNETVT